MTNKVTLSRWKSREDLKSLNKKESRPRKKEKIKLMIKDKNQNSLMIFLKFKQIIFLRLNKLVTLPKSKILLQVHLII
jgi:hypothetical protein